MEYSQNLPKDQFFLQKLLDEENLALMPLSPFIASDSNKNENLQGFRIMVVAKEDLNQQLLERLARFCAKYYK